MGLHRNARLGLAGRRAFVADVEAGSRAGRRRDAGASRRRPLASGGGVVGGDAVQRRSLAVSRIVLAAAAVPRLLPAGEQERICTTAVARAGDRG